MSVSDIVTEVSRLVPGGGNTYYDLLDERLRTPEVFQALHKLAQTHFPHAVMIATGGFGHAFSNWARAAKFESHVVVLPGGLRHHPQCKIEAWRLMGRRYCVLLDDTLYEGRTRTAVEAALNRAGRALDGTFVAFEGPRAAPDDQTFALFHARTDWRGPRGALD